MGKRIVFFAGTGSLTSNHQSDMITRYMLSQFTRCLMLQYKIFNIMWVFCAISDIWYHICLLLGKENKRMERQTSDVSVVTVVTSS